MLRRFEVIEEDCIGCGLCSDRAPENFEIPDDSSTARVCKQPETPLEEEACLEAHDYCPMGGLHAAPADYSASGTCPTLIPAGESTPVKVAPIRLEK